ncbi:hypothetical protein Unana1_04219 [Umbelopsis nana]
MAFTIEQPLLALTLHSMDNSVDVGDLWTVFTRCKNSLQYGRRLENMSWRLWYRQTSLMGSPPQNKASQITERVVELPHSPVVSFKEIVSTFGSSKDQLLPVKPLHDQQPTQPQVETPAPSFQEKPPRPLQGKFFIPSDSETSDSEAEEEQKRPVYRTRHRRRRPSRPETPRTSDWDSDYRCSASSSSSSTFSRPASPAELTEPASSYFAKKTQPTLPCPQRSLLSSLLANNPTSEPPKFLRRSRAPVYQDLNQLADRHLPQQDPCLSESLKRNIIRENSASGCSRKANQPRVVDSNTLALGWSDLSYEAGGW